MRGLERGGELQAGFSRAARTGEVEVRGWQAVAHGGVRAAAGGQTQHVGLHQQAASLGQRQLGTGHEVQPVVARPPHHRVVLLLDPRVGRLPAPPRVVFSQSGIDFRCPCSNTVN